MLEFRILGPLEVVGEQGPIRLGGAKQRATLAILLLNANRVVSAERLADDLYGGATPLTAATQVHRQISELRKLLGQTAGIETRVPGYVIQVVPDQLDLHRFERATEEASEEMARGDAQLAADLLRGALRLWRGAPLQDLAYERFAQIPIERLQEIRLAALEQRIEADLALGRHVQLVGELHELARRHPLREALSRQLMLALYRSGRQAEALEVYRRTREALIEQLGIEPSPTLRDVERGILSQDRSLDLEPGVPRAVSTVESDRVVLVVPSADDRLDAVLTIADPLATHAHRELIIVRLVADARELDRAVSAVNTARASVGAKSRTAAFTTIEAAADAVRLATTFDVEVMLLDVPAGLLANGLAPDLAAMLERSPADVVLLSGAPIQRAQGTGVFVPFGGSEHDWTALEIGARLASALATPLRLVGTNPYRGHRDASRLLADASLAVQRLAGIEVVPLLADPSDEALIAAVAPATCVVVGISPRWRREGIGSVRRALVRDARPPVLLVHGGPRPGGLAPPASRTRFSWTLEGS